MKKKNSSLPNIRCLTSWPDEQHLIRLALLTIKRLDLVAEDTFPGNNFHTVSFANHACAYADSDVLIKKMSPNRLAHLCLLALGPDNRKGMWRRTSPGDLEPIGKFCLEWTGAGTRAMLQHMAWAVLTAAMYDILATEMMIRMEMDSRLEATAFPYYVPPALLTFVGQTRLRLSAEDMVKYCCANRYPQYSQ